MPKSSKIFLNFGMMNTMMNVKMPTATDDDDGRVDHRADDFALERLGLFFEFRKALKNDFQGTAGLAGLDHVHVEAVEALGMLGHRLRKRTAGLDVIDDVDQARSSERSASSDVRGSAATATPADRRPAGWRTAG